ncbi:MAG TPA: hypothetical protein VKX49_26605 [Bryobacteraceae bacterium]|nr:hypothetical protein [Bryobacteraceae bacterium]
MTPVAAWQNFYVIVGSSAGALIGLQFVVLSLIADRRPDADAGQAFATPNIVHFGAVLGISGLLSAPWDGNLSLDVLLALVGISGITYVIVVIRRMRLQTAYRPEFEDWLFHAVLPFAAYIALTVSASVAQRFLRESLFGIGAAALLLLFIGIHNAWDAVTYHVFARKEQER